MNAFITGLIWFIVIGLTALWAVSRISPDNKKEKEHKRLLREYRDKKRQASKEIEIERNKYYEEQRIKSIRNGKKQL